MSDAAREQNPIPPHQLIRMLRLRSGAATHHKLRQTDLARLVGVETRTLQQWENGERLPGANSLQRLIAALLAEKIFLPGEERREAKGLWEAVSQAYNQRPGTYRLYPPFDEPWFVRLLHARVMGLDEESAGPKPAHPPRQETAKGESEGANSPSEGIVNLKLIRKPGFGPGSKRLQIGLRISS